MELTQEQAKDLITYSVNDFRKRKRPVPAYTSILYSMNTDRLDWVVIDGKKHIVMNDKGKKYRVNFYRTVR